MTTISIRLDPNNPKHAIILEWLDQLPENGRGKIVAPYLEMAILEFIGWRKGKPGRYKDGSASRRGVCNQKHLIKQKRTSAKSGRENEMQVTRKRSTGDAHASAEKGSPASRAALSQLAAHASFE